ncbi:NADPH dehydrogenase NamA [Pectinatus frisingensis]|jgi:NADPH2 dehydrogenase|uniref:NADPH dehydrogenase NamA n=1 Tax=Pectinatus frisingensis TaxID=865 RepID=UPI0015F49D25|nr:NADPH dehydrogenase NamA [Pectinatus frisingensis]
MKLFEKFTIKNMTLRNRIVMPPMCMYSAADDGQANDFHLTHYASRAVGGVGLIIVEATGIKPIGRISDNDLGLWEDEQIPGLKKIVDACHRYGSKTALQINHAGRKSQSASGHPVAPSALTFSDKYRTPAELTRPEINEIIDAFKQAASRADAAGFDALEIHAAHGYLLHEFLSPLTNKRTDEYGGSLKNRTRFLEQVLQQVHTVWPADKPVWIRVSASDYDSVGIDAAMMVEIINDVRSLIDMVHVSSGGLLPTPVNSYPGYQAPLADAIRRKCHIPVIAVGLLTNPEIAEALLQTERADLTAFGRELLRHPYFAIQAAQKYGVVGYIPKQYERAYD